MNIIQMMDDAGFLNDRSRSARFPDSAYMKAINSAIRMILEDRLDNIKKPKRYSVESVQRVRDELYTLIPVPVVAAPSGNIVSIPSDYNYYLRLVTTIDGYVRPARPTSFNEYPLLLENPFRKPSAEKPYFDQNAVGINVYYNDGGSFTSAALEYVRNPATVTIGNDSNKISSGATVLTAGTSYIVYEEALHAGVTYVEGAIFVASTAVLTSGIVIPESVIVNCDFPVKLHQEVARLSAAIMNGTVSDFFKKQDLKNDNQES